MAVKTNRALVHLMNFTNNDCHILKDCNSNKQDVKKLKCGQQYSSSTVAELYSSIKPKIDERFSMQTGNDWSINSLIVSNYRT